MNTNLQTAPMYPFNLDGALCPLLNNAAMLAEFYSEERLRHGIKNFCKKAVWPDKPTISFAVSPEKLQELLLSLFNTPAARALLKKQSDADRAVYLDNAIWSWLNINHPQLAERVSKACDHVKDKVFLKPEALEKLLVAVKAEKPDATAVAALAFIVLAFAMLQPDNRIRFGETFLAAFPDYADKFGACQ
jgi:hypothetical protein